MTFVLIKRQTFLLHLLTLVYDVLRPDLAGVRYTLGTARKASYNS